MNNLFKTFALLLFLSVFCSCASVRMQLQANMSMVQLGMSKTEVQASLKIKPDNIVSAERMPENNAVVEVVQYTMYDNDALVHYWLYFVNDKLDSWHRLKPDTKPAAAVKS